MNDLKNQCTPEGLCLAMYEDTLCAFFERCKCGSDQCTMCTHWDFSFENKGPSPCKSYHARKDAGLPIKTARFIKCVTEWRNDARLYRLDPPMFYSGKRKRCYVVVSAVDLKIVMEAELAECEKQETTIPKHLLKTYEGLFTDYFSSTETYVFRTTRLGKMLSAEELDGSYRGGLDHGKALAATGYTRV